jgi:phospholipid transport system substrate-binding protein
MTVKLSSLALVALIAAAPAVSMAQAPDPALAPIDAFDSALIEVMKQGKSLSAEGRYQKLIPAVEQTFDLPTMTRFAVGSGWASASASDQAALIKAFTRLTAANFAHNFSGYGGEQFKTNPVVQTRGLDKLVRTQIIDKSGKATDLNYRMRQSGGRWKVIDVYFGAISQLTAQRSDFASTVSSGGASALVAKMNAKADGLLKG